MYRNLHSAPGFAIQTVNLNNYRGRTVRIELASSSADPELPLRLSCDVECDVTLSRDGDLPWSTGVDGEATVARKSMSRRIFIVIGRRR